MVLERQCARSCAVSSSFLCRPCTSQNHVAGQALVNCVRACKILRLTARRYAAVKNLRGRVAQTAIRSFAADKKCQEHDAIMGACREVECRSVSASPKAENSSTERCFKRLQRLRPHRQRSRNRCNKLKLRRQSCRNVPEHAKRSRPVGSDARRSGAHNCAREPVLGKLLTNMVLARENFGEAYGRLFGL